MNPTLKKKYNQLYYAKNREQILRQKKQYLLENLEAIRAYNRNRHHADKPRFNKKSREYYQQHRQELLEKSKVYHQLNKSEHNSKCRAYWTKNREKLNADAKLKYDKEEQRKWWQGYYLKNRDKLLAKNAAYQKAHPEKTKAAQALRRALKNKVNVDKAGVNQFYSWIRNQDYVTCTYCGVFVTGKSVEIDHIIPITRGGPHDLDNFCLSCKFCNQSKGDKLLSEWPKCPEKFKRN